MQFSADLTDTAIYLQLGYNYKIPYIFEYKAHPMKKAEYKEHKNIE